MYLTRRFYTASAALKQTNTLIDFNFIRNLVESFDKFLGENIDTLKASEDKFEEFIKVMNTGGSFGKVFLGALVNNKNLWKALASSDVFTNEMLTSFDQFDDKIRADLYRKLIGHGLTKRDHKVFRNEDLDRIYNFYHTRVNIESWDGLNKLPLLMKSTEVMDHHLIDKISIRYLNENAPMGYLVQYLHLTWHNAPVNHELNSIFRNNVARYSKGMLELDLIRAIQLLLKTGVRHHMDTIISLLSRIDTEFIEKLHEKHYVSVLFIFIKSKRLQIPIQDEYFNLLANKLKSSLTARSTETLSMIGRAFSEVNFGDELLFTELKQAADQDRGDLILDYLLKTAVPRIETI